MENYIVKKFAMSLLILVLSWPLVAISDPTVTLQTDSLGYPYTGPFVVNVAFSEPVSGFGAAQVNLTNGSVVSITGDGCSPNYVMTIQPTAPGGMKIVIPANSVTSQSSGLPNLVSNTLNMTALNPALRPSSNFDLRQWSLTLPIPIGNRNNAISIGQVTLNGNPSQNTGYSNPPYFFTDPTTGGMNFSVPLNGATTPNSDFSRSELYEILPGATPYWKLSTFASNTLTASLLVSHVPPIEKRFVIAQIHDKGNTDNLGHTASNSPLLKLYYDANALDPNKKPCNGCVYAQIRRTPSQSSFFTIVNLISNVPLNKAFTCKITMLRNGSLTIKANNKSTTLLLSTSTDNTIGWGTQQLYFKAGAYNLEHDSTAGGADSFFYLQVTHS